MSPVIMALLLLPCLLPILYWFTIAERGNDRDNLLHSELHRYSVLVHKLELHEAALRRLQRLAPPPEPAHAPVPDPGPAAPLASAAEPEEPPLQRRARAPNATDTAPPIGWLVSDATERPYPCVPALVPYPVKFHSVLPAYEAPVLYSGAEYAPAVAGFTFLHRLPRPDCEGRAQGVVQVMWVKVEVSGRISHPLPPTSWRHHGCPSTYGVAQHPPTTTSKSVS